MAQEHSTGQEVAALVRRSAEANARLMRGDVHGYLALIRHGADYTLMAPFGGLPVHGFDESDGKLAELQRFFRAGTSNQELVASYASGDLVVLVTLERQRGEIGGLPEQDWWLRVTQVFRREGADWLLVHRHADPLLHGIGVAQAAALARG
jgi:ketosteroid isomerase-like protein